MRYPSSSRGVERVREGRQKAALLLMPLLFILLGPLAAGAASTGSCTLAPDGGTLVAGTDYTLTASYRDDPGAPNIANTYLLINTSLTRVQGAQLWYEVGNNRLWLRDDSGLAWLGGHAPGSANVIENSYVRVSCTQTSAARSGDWLSVGWRIRIKDPMAGKTQRAWLYADFSDKSFDGWNEMTPYTVVLPNRAPRNVSITPSSGQITAGQILTLQAAYSDPNGAADIAGADLLLTTAQESQNVVHLYFDAVENKLYLSDDADAAWLGGVAPGTPGVFENSYCALDTGQTTVTATGTNLVVNWRVALKPSLAGRVLKGQLFVLDSANLYGSWEQLALLTPVLGSEKPVNKSIAPSSGMLQPGVAASLTAVYSDLNGAGDIANCYLLLNSKVDGVGAIYAWYDAANNKLYLRNNANTGWVGGFAPGSSNTIETALAKLHCAQTTATGAGADLTVSFRIEPKAAAAGRALKEFLYVTDKTGLNDGWDELGVVAVNAGPATGALAPAGGTLVTSTALTLTASYSDPNGAADIKAAYLLLNTALDGRNAVYLWYDALANKLYIRDDANGKWEGGIAPGAAGFVENSQVRLDTGATTVTSSGSGLTIAWRVQFKDSLAGRVLRNWLWVQDRSGSSAGWTERAGYTVVLANKAPVNQSITPSSGQAAIGPKLAIQTAYSDANGASDIKAAYLLLNAALEARNAIYLWYDAAGNRLFIRDDPSTNWVGGVAPGTSGFLENSQFRLDTGATTVTANGPNLIVNWQVELKPSLAGKQLKGWLYVSDAAKLSDGWDEMAALTPIIPNEKPVNTSITPSSGTLSLGSATSFGAVYSDADGHADIAHCYLLLNSAPSGTSAIYAWYDAINDRLYLRNDANTAWVGGAAPGSVSTIETARAKLFCAQTTVTRSGADLTVSFSIQPTAAAGGRALKEFLYVIDRRGASDGWDALGTVTVASPGPVNVSLSPDGGDFPAGQTVTFTTTYQHPVSASQITKAYLLLNTKLDGRNAIYVYYDQQTRKLWLRNDANTAWEGGFLPGSPNLVQNTQCWLDPETTTVSASGNTLTIAWRLYIKPVLPASGVRGWMYVTDAASLSDGWDEMGIFGGSRAPANVSVAPSSGTAYAGVRTTLTANYTDPDGAQDIASAYLLVNTSLSSVSGCSLWYEASANRLWLRNDANTAWQGGFAPGSASTIENSQCRVFCQETYTEQTGPNLAVRWRVEFRASTIGKALKSWLYCSDRTGLTDGWDQMGTLAVQTAPNLAPVNTALAHAGILAVGGRITFTAGFSDPNGAADISGVYLLLNEALIGSNASYFRYDAVANKLYLRNDANTVWLGGDAPGSAAVIENASVRLYCADTTATSSGGALTVVWSAEFKSPLAGRSPKGWMYAQDRAGLSDGWDDMGVFAFSASLNRAPSNVSLTPANADLTIGQQRLFSAVYSDPEGFADINSAYLLINGSATGAGGISCWYDRANGKLYLRNDTDTEWLGGFAPGSANVIENSRARLNCAATTVTGMAQTLTVGWSIEPKPAMALRTASGWLSVQDSAGLSDPYEPLAQYSFPAQANFAPACDSLTPSSGALVSDTFIKTSLTAVFSDANGAADLANCELLVNSSLSMANGVYVRYDANANRLYLRDDANTAWLGGHAPGTDNVISNTHAKLYCQHSTVTGFAALEVKWVIEFLGFPASNGEITHRAWTQVSDDASATETWKQMGAYSIEKLDLPPPPGG